MQGKVFAARRFIAQLTLPIAMLAAGFLAERVFEPAMQSGGVLASIWGGILGAEPGAGIALLFVLIGLAATFTGVSGYAVPVIRRAETILPDSVNSDAVASVAAQPEPGSVAAET